MSNKTIMRKSAEASDIAYLDLKLKKEENGELHYVLDDKSPKYKDDKAEYAAAQAKLDEYQSKYEILQAERDPSGFAGVTVRSKEGPSQVFVAMRGTDGRPGGELAKDLATGANGVGSGLGPDLSDADFGMEDSRPVFDSSDPQVAAAKDFSDRAARYLRPGDQAHLTGHSLGGMLQTLQDYGDMGRALTEERRFAPQGAAPVARRPAPATSALAPRVRPVTARDMWRNGEDPQNAYGLLFPEGWNWQRGK